MRYVGVRMMAVVLAGLLAVGTIGISGRAAENAETSAQIRQETAEAAGRTMFSMLGLSFLCAGGMVALIVAKDRT